jgi:hypothetical protein
MKDARFQMIDSDAVGDGDGDDDDGGGGGLEQKSLPPSLSLNQLLSTQVGMGKQNGGIRVNITGHMLQLGDL